MHLNDQDETLVLNYDRWIVSNPQYSSDLLNPMLSVSPWAGHRNFAYDLVSFVKPKRILELGTHYGCSFFAFLQASSDHALNTEHVAVDTWVGEEHAGRYGEDVFEIVNRTIDEFFNTQKVRILRKTFDEALADVDDNSIDLLHIDGFHSYDAASHDYLTWAPKVAENGIVLFHDVAQSSGYGSADFWNEIKVKHPYFEFLEHSFGLGILFPKGDKKYLALKKYLTDDLLDLYRFKAEFFLREKQYGAAKKQLEERWVVMQSMEAMISERDQAMAGQARMLEERWSAMQSMDAMISERDQALAGQARMLDERDQALATQYQFNRALRTAVATSLQLGGQEAFFEKLSGAGYVTPFVDMAFSLTLYTTRLYHAAHADGVRDLFFFAREGQPLKQMFDYYQSIQGNAGVIRTHYLKVSRRSTFLFSLGILEEEDFSVLFRQYRRISILDFLKSLDLDEYAESFASALRISLSEIGVVRDDLPTDSVFQKLRQLELFRQIYEEQRTARSTAFERYMKSLLKCDVLPGELYVVDVGWKGSIQDNLYRWFRKVHGEKAQVRGYYLGLVATGSISSENRKCGLLFSNIDKRTLGFYTFSENRSLFEIILHADHGSARRYILDDQYCPMVIEDDFHESAMIAENIQAVSKPIFELFKEITAVIACAPLSDQDLLRITIERHGRMVFAPRDDEIEWICSVSHVENFGVFEESWFRNSGDSPHLLKRLMFTWHLIRRQRPSELGFWPWLTIRNSALPGMSRLYSFFRRRQNG